jgi:hypothetical protein
MAPLFAFVVLASGHPTTAATGREHYAPVEALRSMEEPEFSAWSARLPPHLRSDGFRPPRQGHSSSS